MRVIAAAVLVLALALIAACGADDEDNTSTAGVASKDDSAPKRAFEQDDTGDDGKKPPEGKGPNVGDHGETGNATFSGFPAGLKIRITGGGASPSSSCTKNESDTSFTTSGKDDQQQFTYIAKSDGSCYFTLSWSDFKVEVRDPSQGNRVIATGYMWMGQPNEVHGYMADCNSGVPGRDSQRDYRWDRMKCEHLSGGFDLKVSPGTKLKEAQ